MIIKGFSQEPFETVLYSPATDEQDKQPSVCVDKEAAYSTTLCGTTCEDVPVIGPQGKQSSTSDKDNKQTYDVNVVYPEGEAASVERGSLEYSLSYHSGYMQGYRDAMKDVIKKLER